MKEVRDESVHLVVTSPPYWQLKDYDTENQIGFHDDYETYINHLNLVWSECHRVLHKGCRLCINIGDQFARSVYYGRYKVIPIRTEIIKFCESIGFDYIFKDPLRLDKKIDVKKLQFGSKIDQNGSAKREEYFTVKEVISPELVRLSNGLEVRLIGVRENPTQNGKASDWLREKTKGQKVFLKFDAVKHDAENRIMAYLYLQNKTFVNAHLIRSGLVGVDNSLDFRYKMKFDSMHNG
ncbi:MAG: hypothetical protein DYG98_17245 [Haliscomenobacteraceae bacterium CHB4]|nr:hypothetical protein [Haliscomenobacteraceae bacterium CHB4]